MSTINAGRKRGRPAVGATRVEIRFPPDEVAGLDEWIEREPDRPGRPEAVRRIVRKETGRE